MPKATGIQAEKEIMLVKSANSLRLLQRYLVDVLGKSQKLKKVSVQYDPNWDKESLKDPRFVAYVRSGDLKIHVSQAIEDLDETVRVGILLHELGHILLSAFGSIDEEVDVDAWILRTIPEAGYTYRDHRYFSSLADHTVKAVNIEHVSRNFLELLNALKGKTK